MPRRRIVASDEDDDSSSSSSSSSGSSSSRGDPEFVDVGSRTPSSASGSAGLLEVGSDADDSDADTDTEASDDNLSPAVMLSPSSESASELGSASGSESFDAASDAGIVLASGSDSGSDRGSRSQALSPATPPALLQLNDSSTSPGDSSTNSPASLNPRIDLLSPSTTGSANDTTTSHSSAAQWVTRAPSSKKRSVSASASSPSLDDDDGLSPQLLSTPTTPRHSQRPRRLAATRSGSGGLDSLVELVSPISADVTDSPDTLALSATQPATALAARRRRSTPPGGAIARQLSNATLATESSPAVSALVVSSDEDESPEPPQQQRRRAAAAAAAAAICSSSSSSSSTGSARPLPPPASSVVSDDLAARSPPQPPAAPAGARAVVSVKPLPPPQTRAAVAQDSFARLSQPRRVPEPRPAQVPAVAKGRVVAAADLANYYEKTVGKHEADVIAEWSKSFKAGAVVALRARCVSLVRPKLGYRGEGGVGEEGATGVVLAATRARRDLTVAKGGGTYQVARGESGCLLHPTHDSDDHHQKAPLSSTYVVWVRIDRVELLLRASSLQVTAAAAAAAARPPSPREGDAGNPLKFYEQDVAKGNKLVHQWTADMKPGAWVTLTARCVPRAVRNAGRGEGACQEGTTGMVLAATRPRFALTKSKDGGPFEVARNNGCLLHPPYNSDDPHQKPPLSSTYVVWVRIGKAECLLRAASLLVTAKAEDAAAPSPSSPRDGDEAGGAAGPLKFYEMALEKGKKTVAGWLGNLRPGAEVRVVLRSVPLASRGRARDCEGAAVAEGVLGTVLKARAGRVEASRDVKGGLVRDSGSECVLHPPYDKEDSHARPPAPSAYVVWVRVGPEEEVLLRAASLSVVVPSEVAASVDVSRGCGPVFLGRQHMQKAEAENKAGKTKTWKQPTAGTAAVQPAKAKAAAAKAAEAAVKFDANLSKLEVRFPIGLSVSVATGTGEVVGYRGEKLVVQLSDSGVKTLHPKHVVANMSLLDRFGATYSEDVLKKRQENVPKCRDTAWREEMARGEDIQLEKMKREKNPTYNALMVWKEEWEKAQQQ